MYSLATIKNLKNTSENISIIDTQKGNASSHEALCQQIHAACPMDVSQNSNQDMKRIYSFHLVLNGMFHGKILTLTGSSCNSDGWVHLFCYPIASLLQRVKRTLGEQLYSAFLPELNFSKPLFLNF